MKQPGGANVLGKLESVVFPAAREGSESSKSMAAEGLTTITEQWIRDKLRLKHPCLSDVRSLSLPGTYEEKISHLGNALHNFVRLKSLDLSCNALVSVEGVQHLKSLERLILYYNCIPSLEELKVLYELTSLRELDLRLNPLTKRYPNFRPYVVHAMPNLCKLDSCSVSDTERKAAIMQFSSDILPNPNPKSSRQSQCEDKRSSDVRLAQVNRLTKRLSLLTEPDDIVLNFVEMNPGDQRETISDTVHKKAGKPAEEEPKYFTEQRSSTPKQETAKSILRYPPTKYDQSQRLCSSFVNIRPPSPHRPGLNLSDPSNPILHPARLTYSSFNKTEGGSSSLQQEEMKKKGSYRKPLEMLLNLVDKHWKGERSLHQNNNFLSQAVKILSMMENDISIREAEVRTLRREAGALSIQTAAQEQEHKTEVRHLSAQLEETRSSVGKQNEQLRIVLEENVALQKQLIKLERQYLKSMMKSSPVTQIKEAQTEVEELRKEIEGLRKKVHEAEKVKESSDILQESQVPGGYH
ncbi:centrosomal protein of 72 kDa isoform X3 [Platichthys flesus]|uniref:centrosomal protein of 72 kDa isoform X3 n=1 Tax=Platichthys flesus TaxID=8260 RepID=UPI002DBBADFB|nr:centrosomal protein of 72 kDa isoform X3 [Platichthys flesus]